MVILVDTEKYTYKKEWLDSLIKTNQISFQKK